MYNKTTAPFEQLKTFIKDAYDTLLSNFSTSHIMIVGDFNIDLKHLNDHETINLKEFLSEELNLIHVTPSNHSSTDYDSQIDHCHASTESIQAYYYETIFSDHKAIWFLLPNSNK